MANELLCISCRCGKEPSAALAGLNAETAIGRKALQIAPQQIQRFLEAHASCPISGFFLSGEDGEPLERA